MNDENKVNRFASCRRCANNGCRYCPECNGFNFWKFRLESPVTINERAKRAREYQRKYYQEHKGELREKRRAYFLKYYHDKLKGNPDEVKRRLARGLKYYYEHHDEIRAKRNAAKKAALLDPVNGDKMRANHTEYMREYRKKKKEKMTDG